MNIRGNTILITGGATGIGLGLSQKFLELDNKVLICGRRKEKLEQARNNIPGLEILQCDISSTDGRKKLQDHISAHFSDMNVLINNAPVMHRYSTTSGKNITDLMEEEISINLTAPMILTAELMPLFNKRKERAVMNVTSAIARIVHPQSPSYCASKAGLSIFTKALREQCEPEGIRVFELIPPPVDTAMCTGSIKKMRVPEIVEETIRGMKNDLFEIRAGSTKLYYWLDGISPFLARKTVGRI